MTTTTSASSSSATVAVSWRVVATVIAGTLLNPLNSSMISVALLPIAHEVHVDIGLATWLISSFYLVGATGMPLAGRLADLYGPRRVFRVGMLVVLGASVLAALAPNFGWLLFWRVIQAAGSAAGSPAGQATFRAQSGSSRPPAQALGAVSMANNMSAALGPVIGGFMVSLAGWPGIFWINVPFTLLGLYMAWRWLPPDRSRSRTRTLGVVLRELDLPGIALFAVAVVGLLAFLLSISGSPNWVLLVASAVAGILLVRREHAVADPFLDVRFLVQNRRLVVVYVEFAAVSLIFYGAFFGLPLWLQQVRHFDPATVGLVLLPISGVAVLLTPLAARLIARRGLRPALVIGSAALLLGVLVQLTFSVELPVSALVAAAAVIGIATAFNNLGLQAALYQLAPAHRMGTATGQFQTFRYVGATLCTALLALVFVGTATTEGLHALALTLAPIAGLLLLVNLRVGAAPD